MNEDLSDLIQNFSNAMNSDSSGELKNMLNNLVNSQDNSSSDNTSSTTNNTINASNSSSSSDFNFDIDSIMKAKKIADGLNNSKDDPRANLLLSLKPYLKDSRKSKIDTYIQLLKMGSIFNLLKENGDENGSDSSK